MSIVEVSISKLVPFRRCSGYSSGEECKFSLLLDVVESETWGGGLVTISHTCSHTNNIRQDCQQDNNQVRNNLSPPPCEWNNWEGREGDKNRRES